jgi:hypothetical protein
MICVLPLPSVPVRNSGSGGEKGIPGEGDLGAPPGLGKVIVVVSSWSLYNNFISKMMIF